MKICTLLPVTVAALCSAAAPMAWGDTVDPSAKGNLSNQAVLEEIIVTAQKRQENLQNVPASIAVVSADRLQENQLQGLQDLQKAVPSFAFTDAGDADGTSVAIRGIGARVTGQSASAIEPSVGTVIDGVVMGRSAMALSNFNDVERVEVLRGPQGTLFGMNSSAGVLNIVTKDPTNDFSGYANIGYGSYNETKTNVAIAGPLVDDVLLGRISLFTDKRDGYIHNIYDDRDLNDDDQKGVRTKLLFTPRDGTKITLNLDLADRDRHCRHVVYTDVSHEQPPSRAAAETSVSGADNDTVNLRGILRTTDKNRGVSLQWDETLGEYQLTSITAYRSWRNFTNAANDIPLDPPSEPIILEANNQNQISEELRIASPVGGAVDYVGGVFAFKQRLVTEDHEVFDLTSDGLPIGLDGHQFNKIETTNYAGFGEGNWHVTDKLTLIGGARWTHTKIDMDLLGLPPDPADLPGKFLLPDFSVGTTKDSVTTSKWSGRFGARWEIVPDEMLYATVSRGFKGPAFNATSGNGSSQRVKPEISTNYEMGWKAELLNRRIRTNIDVFFTDFKDFQAIGTINAGTIQAQSVLLNAPKLQSKGVELDVDAVVTENWNVNLGAAYIDAVYKEFRNAPCPTGEACPNNIQDLSNTRLPAQPKVSANAGSTYTVALGNRPFNGFVHADYSWRDRVLWDPNGAPQTVEGSYGLLGASLGIRDKEDRYSATLYGKNLTDRRHGTKVITPTFGYVVSQFLPPDYQRIYGVDFEYRFK